MTTDLKKNSQQFLPSIDQIERLRVTGVKDFTACPRMWKAKQLGEGVQKESPYARRGTAVHYVIEHYLRCERIVDPVPDDLFDVEIPYEEFLRREGVPNDEIENVFRYLETLAPLRPHLVHAEKQVGFGHCSHWRPIQGHVDAIFSYNDEGDVLILDHKTNRSFRGSDWWKQQPQPRLYAWLVRRLIPTARDVYFGIGYVNLDRRAVWRTDPADDKWCYERYTSILDEIQVYTRTGEWPERINSDCRYCPIRHECPTMQRAATHFTPLVDLQRESKRTDLEVYQWALNVQKSIEGVVEEMRERLVARVTEQGEVVESGYRARLRTNSRRSVSFADAWEAVAPTWGMPSLGGLQSEIERLEEIFTAKIGGLDKFFTKNPEAADRVSRLMGSIVTVKELAPSLVIEEILDEHMEHTGVQNS